MNRLLQNDNVLKVISVLIAILIWAYIIIVNAAPGTKNVADVPIEYKNQTNIIDEGYSIAKASVSNVTVSVEASRKILAGVSSRDNLEDMAETDEKDTLYYVFATVDLANVKAGVDAGDTVTKVAPITIAVNVPESITVKNYNPSTVDLTLERTRVRSLPVSIETTGLVSGYTAGNLGLLDDKVQIQGAPSLLDQLSSVKLSLDFSGVSNEMLDSGWAEGVVVTARYFTQDEKELSVRESGWLRPSLPGYEDGVMSCHVYPTKVVPVQMVGEAGVDMTKYRPSQESLTVYSTEEDVDVEGLSEILTETIATHLLVDAKESDGPEVSLILPTGIRSTENITKVKIYANSNS